MTTESPSARGNLCPAKEIILQKMELSECHADAEKDDSPKIDDMRFKILMAMETSKIANDLPETDTNSEPVTGKFDGRNDITEPKLNRCKLDKRET